MKSVVMASLLAAPCLIGCGGGCGGGSLTGTGGAGNQTGLTGFGGFGGIISTGSGGVTPTTGRGGFQSTGNGGWTFDCSVPEADGGVQNVPNADGGQPNGQPPPALGLLAPLAYRSSAPFGTLLGDVTGDGKADLLAVTDRLIARVNDGNGRFGPETDLGPAPGGYISPVLVADLNGDRDADIIYADAADYPYVSAGVLLGDGGGGFLAPAEYPVGELGWVDIALGDLDGDGDRDIVAFSYQYGQPSEVDVLMNAGDGTFAPAVKYAAAFAAGQLAVADLDGDGRDEVVVDSSGDDSVLVLWNRGDGRLLPPVTFPAGLSPITVVIGDVDGDSRADLVVVNQIEAVGSTSIVGGIRSGVSVLRNLGNGSFAPPTSYTVGVEAASAVLADLNGDSKLDLTVININTTDASVLYNLGNGTFAPDVRLGIGGEPAYVMAGEMNGDGRPDLLFVNQTGELVVALTAPQGALAAGIDYPTGRWPRDQLATPTTPAAVASGDLTSDGLPDLVVTGTIPYDEGMKLLVNKGGGKFDAPVLVDAAISSLASLAITDLNGDGKADLVSGDNDACVYLGGAGGTLTWSGCYANGNAPISTLIGDVNGDGRPDMVLVAPSAIAVYTNTGGGNFSPLVEYGGPSAYRVSGTLADLNGDGRPDLVIAAAGMAGGTGSVYLFANDGTGHFDDWASLSSGSSPVAVAVADLNGDGRQDLAVANITNTTCTGAQGTIDVMFGESDGRFSGIARYGGGGYESIVAADIDGDGDADLLALDAISHGGGWTQPSRVNVFVNDGRGRLGLPLQYATGSNPTSMTVRDLNGDGRLDIAVATSRGAVTVLLNGPR